MKPIDPIKNFEIGISFVGTHKRIKMSVLKEDELNNEDNVCNT